MPLFGATFWSAWGRSNHRECKLVSRFIVSSVDSVSRFIVDSVSRFIDWSVDSLYVDTSMSSERWASASLSCSSKWTWYREGLVFKAHRWLYHSRLESSKEEEEVDLVLLGLEQLPRNLLCSLLAALPTPNRLTLNK